MWLCPGWLGDMQQAARWLDREGDFLILQRRAEPSFQRLLGFGECVATPETRDEELPRKRMLPGDSFPGPQELYKAVLPGTTS